jgi:hypothetical protein
LILRGPTKFYEKDGEERSYYPYVLRARPCADPLPTEPVEESTTTEQPDDLDDPPW